MNFPVIHDVQRMLQCLLLITLTACSTLNLKQDKATEIGQKSGLTATILQTVHFPIFTQLRISQAGEELNIYIEGEAPSRLADPTPDIPLALKLAAQDPSANVAWLARPCQYLQAQSANCRSDYWNSQRYSRELVDAMNKAVNQLKAKSGARRLHLIGYAGGATMALLIAAQRPDIASLRTIAGNLDTDAFTDLHQLPPLTAESNPLRHATVLAKIPQNHWLGQNDTVVPPALVNRYANAVGKGNCTRLQVVLKATHEQGWEKRWIDFLNTPLPCGD